MNVMKPARLAAWIFGAAVCGAWLASAAGVTRAPRAPKVIQRTSDVQLDVLASDVQAQAARLRERLAAAPAPSGADRNPFRFGPAHAVPRRASAPVTRPVAPPAPVMPAELDAREPSIELIGITESRKGNAVLRTAMIMSGANELLMAAAGQRVLERYEIVTVGPDAVELRDLTTGTLRRLVLR